MQQNQASFMRFSCFPELLKLLMELMFANEETYQLKWITQHQYKFVIILLNGKHYFTITVNT